MKEIRKVTIAGAGTMGHSMAQIFARYGYAVTLYNHRQPTLDKAKEKIRETSRMKLFGQSLLRLVAPLM